MAIDDNLYDETVKPFERSYYEIEQEMRGSPVAEMPDPRARQMQHRITRSYRSAERWFWTGCATAVLGLSMGAVDVMMDKKVSAIPEALLIGGAIVATARLSQVYGMEKSREYHERLMIVNDAIARSKTAEPAPKIIDIAPGEYKILR